MSWGAFACLVSDCGNILKIDDCTSDRTRLDYVRGMIRLC